MKGETKDMPAVTKDDKPLTMARAIRFKCLDCCCGDTAEVRECTIKNCSLYPFRMGSYPKDRSELVGEWRRGQ